MEAVLRRSQPLHGTVRVPPDKAILHRCVLLAGVAEGRTTIAPWSDADDCQRTLAVIQALGVAAEVSEQVVRIDGSAGGLRPPSRAICCGESGTSLRLSAGLLVGQPFRSTLTAGRSLSRRPMRRIIEPLAQTGAAIAGTRRLGGRDAYPPLRIEGRRPLRPIHYTMPMASAQVKSAILLAGLWAEPGTSVQEPVATRDHTERALECFGAGVQRDGNSLTLVRTGPLVSPGFLTVPGDISSAVFLLAAAACIPGSIVEIIEVGLNPTRLRVLDVLQRMGAQVQLTPSADRWEPRGRIRIEARPLRATTIEPAEAPRLIDELPALMAAAACAEGTSRFAGIGELRMKETDRIRSMMDGLRRLGARITLEADGQLLVTGSPLNGAAVSSYGDHRTAMAMAVAGLTAGGVTTVRGAECVAKSFPGFFQTLESLTPPGTVTLLTR